MGHLRFVVSLTNKDNDYQIEQAAAAQDAAKRLAVDVEISTPTTTPSSKASKS